MSATGAPERLWGPLAELAEPVEPVEAAPRRVVDDGPATEDELGLLVDQLHEVCASAVDPLEVAAALEFQGIGDAAAARYGHETVFSLAEAVYAATARQPPEPPPAADPWQSSRQTPVLHALCYGLPALCFPAAAGLLRRPGTIPVLVVTLLATWSLGQGVGQVGYARLGAGGEAAAAAGLRLAGAGAFGLVAAAAAATVLAVHASAGVWWFSLGEGGYMAGAAVLLTLGEARWLLGALAPGVVAGGAFLAAGRPAAADPFVWALLACTPAAALALAAVRTRGTRARTRLRLGELAAALPAVGFGLGAAGLLVLPVAEGLRGRGGPNPAALLASVPVSLSMGVGEWRLLWYRRRVQRLLAGTDEPRRFAATARGALAAAVGQYAVGAAVLLVVAAAIAVAAGLVRIDTDAVVELVAYLLLAIAMFLALTLQALGARAVTFALVGAAVVAELVLSRLGVISPLSASAGLLVAVGAYGLVELARPTRHG